MNINKLIGLMLVLPALIISLSGCRGTGQYADDVVKNLGNKTDDVAENLGNKTDDVAENLDNKTDDVAENLDSNTGDVAENLDSNTGDVAENLDSNTGEIMNMAKERLVTCAKGASESTVEQTLKTAISSGYSQVSVEYLLNVSMNAIQEECFEVKLAKMTYDALSRESAESSVSSAESEYQGQIEFVLP